MKHTLSGIFCFYLAVFLAVVFGSWFLFLRRRRRTELSERRIFICGFCDSEIPDAGLRQRLRCPECGAVQERQELKEK